MHSPITPGLSTIFHVLFLLKSVQGFFYASHQSLVNCSEAKMPIQFPSTVQELQDLSKTWIQEGLKLKAVGSLHSISDIICTDGVPISLKGFKHAKYNVTTKVASVSAGMTLTATLEFLEHNGRSLIVTPEWGDITIGGAIGTGAHGSSLRHVGTISDQMLSAIVINSLGEMEEVSRGDPHFDAFKLHLGLLGILVSIELETVPLFKVTKQMDMSDDRALMAGDILSWVRAHDLATVFWIPSLNTTMLVNGTFKDVTAKGDAVFKPLEVEESVAPIIEDMVLDSADPSSEDMDINPLDNPSMLKDYYASLMPDKNGSGSNPATGMSWRLNVAGCDEPKCIWTHVPFVDSSVFLPLKHFQEFVQFIKPMVVKYPQVFGSRGLLFIRFVKGSSAMLSPTQNQDSFVVEWVTPKVLIEGLNVSDPRPRYWAQAHHDIVTHLIERFEGFPHWGKGAFCYVSKRVHKGIQQFTEVMRASNLSGVFQNSFSILLEGAKLHPHSFCGLLRPSSS